MGLLGRHVLIIQRLAGHRLRLGLGLGLGCDCSIEVYNFGAVAGADSTGAVCMAAEPGARRTVDSTAAEAAEEEAVDNQGEMEADMTDMTGLAVWSMDLVPVVSPTVSSCSCGAGFDVWGLLRRTVVSATRQLM